MRFTARKHTVDPVGKWKVQFLPLFSKHRLEIMEVDVIRILYVEHILRNKTLQNFLDQFYLLLIHVILLLGELHILTNPDKTGCTGAFEKMLYLEIQSWLLRELQANRLKNHQIFLRASLQSTTSQLPSQIADLIGDSPLFVHFHQLMQPADFILRQPKILGVLSIRGRFVFIATYIRRKHTRHQIKYPLAYLLLKMGAMIFVLKLC